jgi:hypothetical protein
VNNTNSKPIKVVKLFSANRIYQCPEMVEHYPRHVETLMMKLRNYGLYHDEHQDLKEEMTRLRALRGKVKSK